uniref:THAP-type domain-containing protein n=1 Tax=Neogobius melanostomus TaxID=47308 RepID=A0A8C6V1W2_9GOBI
MPSCSAINCAKRSVRTINKSNTINFCVIRFSFPLGDKTRLAQWVHKVKRKDWVPNMNSRLCASHFAEECFVITGGKKHLTPTAVPTIFDFSLNGKCMTAQEKPGNDASTTPIAPPPPDIQPTTSKEHNYTVSRSPKSIKRQMETQLISVEERLDHCRKKLKTEQRRTCVIGFIASARSALNIFHDLVEKDNAQCRYLLTYKLSQDHLELFFSSVRARGGFNNNPTTRQFTAAYKRICSQENQGKTSLLTLF